MKIINVENKSKLYFEENIFDLEELNAFKKNIEILFLQSINGDNYIRNLPNSNKQQALWFGPVNYKYGKYKELKSKEFPEFVKKIALKIEKISGFKENYLNSVYINKYFNGGMGKHHDNDAIFKSDDKFETGSEIIVAVFSIGDLCEINIYKNYKDKYPCNRVIAKDNSLYIMGENFQNNFYHEVKPCEKIRFSFTFRNVKK